MARRYSDPDDFSATPPPPPPAPHHSPWSLGQRNACGSLGAMAVVLLLIGLTLWAEYDWHAMLATVEAPQYKEPSTAILIPYTGPADNTNMTVLLRSILWHCESCHMRVYYNSRAVGDGAYVQRLQRWRNLEAHEMAGDPQVEWKTLVREALKDYEQVVYITLPYYVKRSMNLATQLEKFGGYFGALPRSTRDNELCGTAVQGFKRGAPAAEQVLQQVVSKEELASTGARCREMSWGLFGISSLHLVQKDTANFTAPFLARKTPVVNATREIADARTRWRHSISGLKVAVDAGVVAKQEHGGLWSQKVGVEQVFMTILPSTGASVHIMETPLCKHFAELHVELRGCSPMPVGTALVKTIADNVRGLVGGGVGVVLGVHETSERQRWQWRQWERHVHEAAGVGGDKAGFPVRVVFLPRFLTTLPATWAYNYMAKWVRAHVAHEALCVVSPLAEVTKHPGWASLSTTLSRRTALFPTEQRNGGRQQSVCVHRTHFDQYPYLFPPSLNFNMSLHWLNTAYSTDPDAKGTVPPISHEYETATLVVYPDRVYGSAGTLHNAVFNESTTFATIDTVAREIMRNRSAAAAALAGRGGAK